MAEVVEDAHDVGQGPADGDGPPDADHLDGGEGIGQDQAHGGLAQGTVESIKEEEAVDASVECTLDPEVAGPFPNDGGLTGADEEGHQGGGEDPDQEGDQDATGHGEGDRLLQAAADPVFFFCPIILGNEGGEGVAEVLNGHIGEGVDLDSGGEGGHDCVVEGALWSGLFYEISSLGVKELFSHGDYRFVGLSN